ncbi:MAG: hypothetical protein P4N60_05985 [Verrucomicrobiae bacterium]|nr:hypothetical protein [Verrucomicrobiae bacterium]
MKFPPSLITGALLVSLFTGCSRHASATAAARVTALGTVEVLDGVSSRHDMGGGRVCVILPSVMKDGTVKLSMTIEEAGPSSTTQKSVLNVITLPDRAVEVKSGGVGISLTPHIKK